MKNSKKHENKVLPFIKKEVLPDGINPIDLVLQKSGSDKIVIYARVGREDQINDK